VTRGNDVARRLALAERDGGLFCGYCRVVLPVEDLTADHIVPKSRGGDNTYGNLVLCCAPCNVGPPSEVYASLFQQVWDLPDDDLDVLAQADEWVTETNCGWEFYGVARLLAPEARHVQRVRMEAAALGEPQKENKHG
jgi:5-methylcytosine-specific restriction endonuclease McrA